MTEELSAAEENSLRPSGDQANARMGVLCLNAAAALLLSSSGRARLFPFPLLASAAATSDVSLLAEPKRCCTSPRDMSHRMTVPFSDPTATRELDALLFDALSFETGVGAHSTAVYGATKCAFSFKRRSDVEVTSCKKMNTVEMVQKER